MSESPSNGLSRRELLKTTGRVAAATGLAGMMVPKVHAAESNTIQVALVGCGGRGTGAAVNALSTKSGPTKLVAMADVFPKKLAGSYDAHQTAIRREPTRSTCRTIASSSASTATSKRWTV